ncbi:MAG: acyl-CoA dehydrogenase C-terminal domain-containing protein, partial [Cypionkella sp.]|nr:acyl-CoA dehydrogenase C-terminal domain-containing protein [Cypionkella sp.]
LQGRDVTGAKNPSGPADPLIVHPDIRRNLLEQKSFVEGARAMTFWGANLIDRAVRSGDAQAEGLISLLTPVIKGFQTDKGFEMAVQAQQIWGGHGYIEDNGAAQLVRDARIAQIYEGANGIQALDLVGRKLAADGGRPIMALFEMVKGFIKENQDDARMNAFTGPLKAASKDVQAAAMYFMENAMKNPNNALAGAYDFMHMMGHTVMGLMWAKMARAAYAALDAGRGDAAYLNGKITTGQFYMARSLPATALHLARIQTGGDAVMCSLPGGGILRGHTCQNAFA